MKKFFTLILLTVAFYSLVSCTTAETVMFKNELAVQTKMTDTILLEPVEPHQRTIYVEIKNTTTKRLNIQPKIEAILRERGYQVLRSPSKAHYWMRVNILKVEEATADSRNYDYHSSATTEFLDMLASNLVKNKHYQMITDIAISEKTKYAVNQYTENITKQGRSGSRLTTSASRKFQDDYFTKVISVINKANLTFEEAIPKLEEELAVVISGIF